MRLSLATQYCSLLSGTGCWALSTELR